MSESAGTDSEVAYLNYIIGLYSFKAFFRYTSAHKGFLRCFGAVYGNGFVFFCQLGYAVNMIEMSVGDKNSIKAGETLYRCGFKSLVHSDKGVKE